MTDGLKISSHLPSAICHLPSAISSLEGTPNHATLPDALHRNERPRLLFAAWIAGSGARTKRADRGAAAPRSARQDDGWTMAGSLSRLGECYPGCLLAAGGCEDELGAALFGDLTNQGWPIFLKQREGVVLVACLTGQRLLLPLAVHFPGELAIGLESQCDRQVRGGLSLPGTHEAGRRRRRRLGLRRLLCRRR